jgi:S1-C subfamily serine protease
MPRFAGGHGSGAVVDSAGTILTARHVVADAQLLVVLPSGTDTPHLARAAYVDPQFDFAFLRATGTFGNRLEMPRSSPETYAGQSVLVAGFPLRADERFAAVTSGQLARVTNSGDYQLSMAVNHGNSGGPLVDDDGRLIGIVFARPRQEDAEGIGYAVPIGRTLNAYRTLEDAPTLVQDPVGEALMTAMSVLYMDRAALPNHGEFADQLRVLERSDDALGLVFAAAVRWDVVMHRYGLARGVALDGPSQGVVLQNLQLVIRACLRADAIDHSILQRNPFASAMIQLGDKLARPRPVMGQ